MVPLLSSEELHFSISTLWQDRSYSTLDQVCPFKWRVFLRLWSSWRNYCVCWRQWHSVRFFVRAEHAPGSMRWFPALLFFFFFLFFQCTATCFKFSVLSETNLWQSTEGTAIIFSERHSHTVRIFLAWSDSWDVDRCVSQKARLLNFGVPRINLFDSSPCFLFLFVCLFVCFLNVYILAAPLYFQTSPWWNQCYSVQAQDLYKPTS